MPVTLMGNPNILSVLPIAVFHSPKYFEAISFVNSAVLGSASAFAILPSAKLKSNILKNCGSAINRSFPSLNFLRVEPSAAVTFTCTPPVPKMAAAFVS